MIISFVFLLGVAILQTVNTVLGIFDFIIPTNIQSSLVQLFSYLRIFNGVFPMDTLISALLTYLSVWILIYGIKIALTGFSMVRGNNTTLPKHSRK